MKYERDNYINIYEYQKTQYRKILNILVDLCSIFQIVEEYGDLEIEKLEIYDDLIEIKRSNKWPGTKIKGAKAYIYSFTMTQNIKKFLGNYDRFLSVSDNCILTKAFNDQSDYSFFEKKTGDCLLYTITHEGDIFLREDIYNIYF